MPREAVEPTTNEHGDDVHPAWGNISVSRSQGTPRHLFDSEIKHSNTIRVTIAPCTRKRDLNRDWLHPSSRKIIEIEMSEAQWAGFVSSPGSGAGSSCTIRWNLADGGPVPDFPHSARLQESMDEVRAASEKAIARVREAFELVKEKPNKGNIRNLEITLGNLPANMVFAAKSLTEHTENVVEKAKADIEAMVVAKAEQLGLDPAETGVMLQLDAGDERAYVGEDGEPLSGIDAKLDDADRNVD